jgi:hypothetical protein
VLLGFHDLGGRRAAALWLPIGGSLVLIGFVLGGADIAITIWNIRPLPLHRIRRREPRLPARDGAARGSRWR